MMERDCGRLLSALRITSDSGKVLICSFRIRSKSDSAHENARVLHGFWSSFVKECAQLCREGLARSRLNDFVKFFQ